MMTDRNQQLQEPHEDLQGIIIHNFSYHRKQSVAKEFFKHCV